MDHPLTMAEAERVIQRIALTSGGIGFRSYCLSRMVQRGLDAFDIERLLRNPHMVCPAYLRNGEWRYRVVERAGNAPPERRGINVVVVIMSEVRLRAHTVYRQR